MRHDTTLVAARILGPLLVATGIMFITQAHRALPSLAGFLLNDELVIMGGFLSLTLGLMLVTFHNRWDTISGMIITVIGIVMAARGALLLLAPSLIRDAVDIVVMRQPQSMPIAGCAIALLGVWLTYTGYISGTLRVDTGR